MIVSEVRYERVNGKLRFDAEYYQPRFLEIEKTLKQSRCVSLREIIKFSKLRRDPRNNPDKEFRYIDITNINIFTGEISSQKLKGYQAPSRARKVVKEKEIVLSTVRPNRNAVAIIPRELDGEICSTGFAVIKAEKINPYFLFVFLKTKYATDQLVRQTMASMYPAVSEEDIGSVLVPLPPIPFQEKIESLIKEVHKKRDKANKKYEETERVLNKTLGIENLKLRRNKIFETRLSEVGIENRFDAEYYEPRFTEISKILKTSRYDCKRLRDLGRLVNLRVNPSERPANKFTYVEIGDVDISTGEIEIKTVLGYEAPPNARKLLKKGDLIISMVRPTRGAITIIPEELDNSVGSTAFYVLRAESPLKESLFVYLRSFLGLSQLGRAVVGAMYPTLKENYIDNILVPIIPEERQKRISSLVIESFNLRKDAKEFLDRARREVEGFIESKDLWRRGGIQTNYKGTVPLLLTEKVKFIKFPVRIKYKEY
ncbi:restriction endonuclease subunit S, partial [bacterium]|nr:restriction endonuclease subunit S [bacterium]